MQTIGGIAIGMTVTSLAVAPIMRQFTATWTAEQRANWKPAFTALTGALLSAAVGFIPGMKKIGAGILVGGGVAALKEVLDTHVMPMLLPEETKEKAAVEASKAAANSNGSPAPANGNASGYGRLGYGDYVQNPASYRGLGDYVQNPASYSGYGSPAQVAAGSFGSPAQVAAGNFGHHNMATFGPTF
jgi:hypothetical protein